MSNEMPEKIHARKSIKFNHSGTWAESTASAESYTEYIAADGETINELRRQNAALKEFAIKINQKVWECGDVDGDEVQELGEAFGIIEPHNVTQEDHDKGQYTDWNIGDPMFQLTDWMLSDTAMPCQRPAKRKWRGSLLKQ